jgi:hypothetical protein
MAYLPSLDRTLAPSDYDEAASEFDAIVPDWERRLAEYDGDLVGEQDFAPEADTAPDGFHRGTIDEWDWFRSL